MSLDVSQWTRMEFDGMAIYVRPDMPDWFVPNRAGDAVLRSLAGGGGYDGDLGVERFLDRVGDTAIRPYTGRGNVLTTDRLAEVWFHVTNRCNLRCSHCLFSSAPEESSELGSERICDLATEAADLGCRVFALTGGEPFVHRDITAIVEHMLSLGDSNVAILTNGTLLKRHAHLLTAGARGRVHLQVSLDGLGEDHDRIRGAGAFNALTGELGWLAENEIPFTLSTCVVASNVAHMPAVVDAAASLGASNVHFMWYFVRGRGDDDAACARPETIFENLAEAARHAEAAGIAIDNIDALAAQVFAPSGTIHDGSGAGWDSLAVGPDGRAWPSAAMVGIDELACDTSAGLGEAWRTGKPMQAIRQATAADTDSPLRFILGGGDPDHSYTHAGTFVGNDPYQPLHERTALWLIARRAAGEPDDGAPKLRLRMGDVLSSCGPHGPVATVHSNCLLAVADVDGRTAVRQFYADAVANPREDISNPVVYPEDLIDHIPAASRVRSYGCGSPVVDAGLTAGHRVVDLGCGTGIECFIASRLVGPLGRVFGVDMLDPMLAISRRSAYEVAAALGYGNVEFLKGYLEDLPLDDASVDVVLSNCVVNLSTDKRRTFAEIRRVLADGGRLVISDVVCESESDPAIRNDEALRGQCIAGALTQRDLFALLNECGFVGARAVRRFPYRTVRGHQFYSLTFEACKPVGGGDVSVMYRGPGAAVVTPSGAVLPAGRVRRISAADATGMDAEVFLLGQDGQITNADFDASCCACAVPPEHAGHAPLAASQYPHELHGPEESDRNYTAGCMVCGAALDYRTDPGEAACHFCGLTFQTNAICENGHFVCDACHCRDALALVRNVCVNTSETDMVALAATIRSYGSFGLHGPEHHALVPGVILATYRNLGGHVGEEQILTGIARGASIIGGSCGFMGVCGAATGVGIALAVILDANPVKPAQRQVVQSVTCEALARIAALNAARCCQRDVWLALRTVARLSRAHLDVPLRAEAPLVCDQMALNPECIGSRCPIHPANRGQRPE